MRSVEVIPALRYLLEPLNLYNQVAFEVYISSQFTVQIKLQLFTFISIPFRLIDMFKLEYGGQVNHSVF